MRAGGIVVLLLGLGACAPVPDSGNVIYLEPVSPNARAARDAALEGRGTSGASAFEQVTPGASAMTTVEGHSGPLTDTNTYATPAPVITHVTPAPVPVPQASAKPVPSRPSDTGPSVVGFALATSHPVGQAVYPRANASSERAVRGCDRYNSDDLAQAAFLNSGGPDRDTQGIDPDGDGYACGWDPERFRKAVQ